MLAPPRLRTADVTVARLSVRILLIVPLLLLETWSCSAAEPGATSLKVSVATERVKVRIETVVSGLEHPWGIAFFPDGRALITERPGRMRMLERDGRLGPPITGLPAVYASGQGGLLDVVIDPEFATNSLVFVSFAEPREGGANATSVARGGLRREALRRAGDFSPATRDAGRSSLRIAARVRA